MESVCSSRKTLPSAIPFAALSATSGVGSLNRLLWKGYLYDADLGCYCLGRRHYDPFALRFLEPDGIPYLDPSVPGGANPYLYCLNDPVTYVDQTGQDPVWWNPATWDWEAIGKGVGLVLLGVGAIVAGIATLPFGGWAAVIGGITLLAGGGTVVFGLADTWEGMSGYNGLRETVFMGNQQAYDLAENVFKWTVIVGTVACGIYGLTHTTVAARSVPSHSRSNGGVWDAKHRLLGYYGKDGSLRYSIHLTNHGKPATHAFFHWHFEMPHTAPINNAFEFLWHLFGGMMQ